VQQLLSAESRPDALKHFFELRRRANEVGEFAHGAHLVDALADETLVVLLSETIREFASHG